jgi:hypothetical protein
MSYIVRDREAGNQIDQPYSLYIEAYQAVAEYEQEDMREGNYTRGFYEIAEVTK